MDMKSIQGTQDKVFTKKDILALESGLYGGVNEDGQKVVVGRDKGNGYSVRTIQDNGWHRVCFYDEEGFIEYETYEKGVVKKK